MGDPLPLPLHRHLPEHHWLAEEKDSQPVAVITLYFVHFSMVVTGFCINRFQ